MPYDELQAAREEVARLERKDELTKRKAALQKELQAVDEELSGQPQALVAAGQPKQP